MNDSAPVPAPVHPKRRRAALVAVSFFLLLAAAAAIARWWAGARQHETTDDAYVGGDVIPLTAETGGTVVTVAADDNDRVEAGQVLVTLDATDARIAVQQAEAGLGAAVRQVRSLYAEVPRQEALVALARVALARAEADLVRRQDLPADGSVLSVEDLQHARDAVTAARAALKVAEESLAATCVPVAGATVETHPLVEAAAARLREALLAQARTEVHAASAGWVAKRAVQLGQRIQPGAPLLAIVPLDRVWVEANFKERQLARLRLGQKAALRADVYGSAVAYHGTITGLGIGTGSAFAIIPAQNASGNWIKIVQRLPVRILLDPAELTAYPLRIGLSMAVEVDTADESGPVLAATARSEPVLHTESVGGIPERAEERVGAIIAANLTGEPALR